MATQQQPNLVSQSQQQQQNHQQQNGQQPQQQQQNGTGHQQMQVPMAPSYSIPGIVHYLQSEWSKFEVQRQQWEVERAELQAKIALLQGERKGQENLKNDLVRRIKMLEYCLRQERAKYHKLKFGVDPPNYNELQGKDDKDNVNSLEDSIDINESHPNQANDNMSIQSSVNWKQGRQLLRQYLQEIGYTDTIIDVRSNRVRSLLGLNSSNQDQDSDQDNNKAQSQNANSAQNNKFQSKFKPKLNRGNISAGKWNDQNQSDGTGTHGQSPLQPMVSEAEASVLATFEFLNEQRDRSADDDDDEDDDDDFRDETDHGTGKGPGQGSLIIDAETEEVLSEFDFLSAHSHSNKNRNFNKFPNLVSPRRNDGLTDVQGDIGVDIGELAALTVANESLDLNGAAAVGSNMNTEFRKTWNPKYILKSHFDGVRCLRFHATEPLLVTCSEDETIKLWNLNKTQQQSSKGKQPQPTGPGGGTTFDLEPVYTFRGHTSRVLSLAISGNLIYSGAQNGLIMIWSIPNNISSIDQYDLYDATLLIGQLEGHKNSIWSLVITTSITNPSLTLLCSASADQTIKIWDTTRLQCIKTITIDEPKVSPTCLAAIPSHNTRPDDSSATNLLAASFTNGKICVYDIESSSTIPVLVFEHGTATPTGTSPSVSAVRINAIAVHPSMPVIVSAHEDRQIKLWDLNTGKCQNAMVAHLDEVTCVAFDPNGLYVLSGSHDCSVRLWSFETRTCVQEITSHRKKFDEAIFDVTFHPTKPYFASAGADALAKVFV